MNFKHEIDTFNKQSAELMVKKNEDYSGDNLIKVGPAGIASRMVDKTHRLLNLTASNNPINNESIDDTLMDIINYAHLYRLEDKKMLRPKYSMVYLAGPIDDIDHNDAKSWRDLMARQLWTKGISCYNPVLAFKLNVERRNDYLSKQVITINKRAIEACDLLVANLSGPGRGFGTIREIEYAKSIGKEVIIIGQLKSLSTFDCLVFEDTLDFYKYLGVSLTSKKQPTAFPKEESK